MRVPERTHALALVVASAFHVGDARAQAVTTRPLGAILARSRDSLGANLMVRALDNGRVIVNDASKRRLLMFDSTLATVTVIADSASGAQSYGSRPAGLIPYRADSTLFVDATSSSFLVVDPNGKVARVMSAPRSQDVTLLAAPPGGLPRIDPRNRLVYRGIARNTAPIVFSSGGSFVPPTPPDSAPILRVDLSTRKLDTVVWIRLSKQRMTVTTMPTGGISIGTVTDPLPITDDWALLSDGSVAVVKGRDYHVEVVHPDGTRSGGQKLLFDWQRLTDEDKVAVIDSTRKALDAARAAPPPNSPAAPPAVPGLGPMIVSPSELPDYRPAFRVSNMRGDDEGRLWVQTSAPKPPSGGLLVDVISASGELVDRIELPPGRTLAAVGPNGTVYLVAHDATGAYLERARVR